MLFRLHLLPCLLLAFTCCTARAADVMEQAQLKVFFVDVYLSTAADSCAQKYPELRQQLLAAQQAFHQRLLPDIERGREVGRALVAPSGKDVDQMAQRIADQNLATSFLTTPSSGIQRLCEDMLGKGKSPMQWSIDDFLRQDFESLKMEVENRQGLPCDMIAISFDQLAHRFLELPSTPSEMLELAGSLLRLQLGDLKKKASNCLAVQARAAEYRVIPNKDLGTVAELLDSMEAVLAPAWDSRAKTVESTTTVGKKVEEFLATRVQK
ncbi:hypothetical protein ACEN8I_00025 [Polaromonas sp. CT11-55]|uniref:hypothetical protein n=1 Tax=Polaromonas sp. CT11-55 TaxID=3243045 RepID=UPI0039A5B48F